MELIEMTSKEEMLENFDILTEVYPSLSLEEYSNELDKMLAHNYGQVAIFIDGQCAGLTGYWIGTKLWCRKYMELDNVVVSEKFRNQGIGNKLFEYMKTKAEQESCTMLALDTYTDNFKAHKFFYSEGYIPRGFHFINILDKDKIR